MDKRAEKSVHLQNKAVSVFSGTVLMLFLLFFSGCSLKYSESVSAEDKVPEFVFEQTELTRFENNKPVLNVSAQMLEQYKGTDETYAKNVRFLSYNDEGNITTEGSCGILFADTNQKIYELYDDINLYNSEEKMRFYASVLKWNDKTEQLTSGRSDMVKVEKEDTVIRGSGFSASGVSKQFSFRGNVTGEILAKENKESSLENGAENE